MGEKFVKKKVWMDEDGVSEILGDVLILGMTIVLFAGVFLFVYTFPAPDEDIYAEFQSSLLMNEDGGIINVTHTGGETLRGHDTKIYLQKNATEEVRILDTQGEDEDNPFYGIEGDENWSPGEIWSYFFGGISSEDNLAIVIIDIDSNRMVMKSNLLYNGFNAPPIVMGRGYYPEPAINNSNLTIFAKVQDPNGDDDIENVYFNAFSLNPDLGIVEMQDENGDSIFESEIYVSNGKGNYEVTIHAIDSKGKADFGRLCLSVEEAAKPIVKFVAIEPNSVEVGLGFVVRAMIVDRNHDLNFSDVSITPEEKFYDNFGSVETSMELVDEIPHGGIFEASGFAPSTEGVYELTLQAVDYTGLSSIKKINLAVIESDIQSNLSYNDTIWAYIGPASLEFKKFYYTTYNPPNSSTEYHLAVFIEEEHIGDDCYLHINIINHYYEDLFIDGNSKIRLLQIGGAASNKDIGIVQNETDFGEEVGTNPDGTWYKIPAPEDGDYFHGGEPVSLVFGPFDMQSAKEGDVFGSILVLTGSFGEESTESENRYGQTLPFQAIVIA
jgi:hypothetical protein